MKSTIIKITDYRFTFHVLMAGVFLSVAFYMYCINATVRNAVVRNNTLDKVSTIQAHLSELETRYIVATNSITLDTANSLGLKDPANKIFISKVSTGASLSFNR